MRRRFTAAAAALTFLMVVIGAGHSFAPHCSAQRGIIEIGAFHPLTGLAQRIPDCCEAHDL